MTDSMTVSKPNRFTGRSETDLTEQVVRLAEGAGSGADCGFGTVPGRHGRHTRHPHLFLSAPAPGALHGEHRPGPAHDGAPGTVMPAGGESELPRVSAGADFPADRAPFRHPLGLMFATAAFFNAQGVHIRLRSDSPPRSALGGSSVAAVALVRAFMEVRRRGRSIAAARRPLHRPAGPRPRGECGRGALRLPGPAGGRIRRGERLALAGASPGAGVPAGDPDSALRPAGARTAPAGGLCGRSPRIQRHQFPVGAAVRRRPLPGRVGRHPCVHPAIRGGPAPPRLSTGRRPS